MCKMWIQFPNVYSMCGRVEYKQAFVLGLANLSSDHTKNDLKNYSKNELVKELMVKCLSEQRTC